MSRVGTLPQVVADLTFTPVRPPVVGEQVLVADSGAGPYKATITAVEPDGTLTLAVHAFVPART